MATRGTISINPSVTKEMTKSDRDALEDLVKKVKTLLRASRRLEEDLDDLEAARKIREKLSVVSESRLTLQRELAALVAPYVREGVEVAKIDGVSVKFSPRVVDLLPRKVSENLLKDFSELEVDGIPAVRLQLDMDVVKEAIRRELISVETLEDAGVLEAVETRVGYVSCQRKPQST